MLFSPLWWASITCPKSICFHWVPYCTPWYQDQWSIVGHRGVLLLDWMKCDFLCLQLSPFYSPHSVNFFSLTIYLLYIAALSLTCIPFLVAFNILTANTYANITQFYNVMKSWNNSTLLWHCTSIIITFEMTVDKKKCIDNCNFMTSVQINWLSFCWQQVKAFLSREKKAGYAALSVISF